MITCITNIISETPKKWHWRVTYDSNGRISHREYQACYELSRAARRFMLNAKRDVVDAGTCFVRTWR